MLVVRCRECQTELTSHETKSQSCGCPNMMTVKGDSVTAVDLNRVVMISSGVSKKKKKGEFYPIQILCFKKNVERGR